MFFCPIGWFWLFYGWKAPKFGKLGVRLLALMEIGLHWSLLLQAKEPICYGLVHWSFCNTAADLCVKKSCHLKLFCQNSWGYLRKHFANTRLVWTYFDPFFMLNISTAMTIWISKTYNKLENFGLSSALNIHMEKVFIEQAYYSISCYVHLQTEKIFRSYNALRSVTVLPTTKLQLLFSL